MGHGTVLIAQQKKETEDSSVSQKIATQQLPSCYFLRHKTVPSLFSSRARRKARFPLLYIHHRRPPEGAYHPLEGGVEKSQSKDDNNYFRVHYKYKAGEGNGQVNNS